MTGGWNLKLLADGGKLPEIGFGSWTAGSGQTVTDQVEQALSVGFSHLDTAQSYANEKEVGKGILESGLNRSEIWVTTKWSGKDNKGIKQSLNESLDNLGLKSVDLYLIHHPRLVVGDPLGAWKEFEELKKEGLVKSIGVSNYKIEDLEILRLAGMTVPVVNQILLHPYVYAQTIDLLTYHAKHNIVTEAYSSLIPITKTPGGPVDIPVTRLAEKYGVPGAEILFAWTRSKGAVIVTSSRQKDRLESYLDAGHVRLTVEEIEEIDRAGAKGMSYSSRIRMMMKNSTKNEKKKNLVLGVVVSLALVGVKIWMMV